MLAAAEQDWGAVEPAIFGTLFERSLDPSKRAQIGAHYTSREDIMLIVEPVVMSPLRREWTEVRDEIEAIIEKRRSVKTKPSKKKADTQIANLLDAFIHRLASVRILDPACGSGNFLYVAIQQLLDLEKEVITFAARPDIGQGLFPKVRPTQLHGIEINAYAKELAQVVIWIGYLQWMRDNGFIPPSDPILEPLETIECRDAILDLTDPQHPTQPQWPGADFIIGNPPFLGSKLFRQNGLDDDYVQAMYNAFDLPRTSDLCCYWFEMARCLVERYPEARCGLLATQGIRGGFNRAVLDRIKETGDIFMAWSDREWILDGAAVRVSMVGFDSGAETERALNGDRIVTVNADLSAGVDVTTADPLPENRSIGFMGDTKVGPFEIPPSSARQLLGEPNPHGLSNSVVLRPWINGSDITKRPRGMWIVDFPPGTSLGDASQFEAPFRHVERFVRPMRRTARSGDATGVQWWLHQRPRPDMREQIEGGQHYIASPRLTKHRFFVWRPARVLPDCQVIAFARSDNYFYGVLQSSIHELWALRRGTQLEDRPRYTPTTCFETFPMPWPPGAEPADHAAYQQITEAARELNDLRERWLNPPEWIDPLAAQIDASDNFADVPADARALIRESTIMAAAAKDPQLKKRTLTNLYNERPTWLRIAHEKLDRAVLAAYAATDLEADWSEDWAEVWTETGAGQPLEDEHVLKTRRTQVEQRVLEMLLRLNRERAG